MDWADKKAKEIWDRSVQEGGDIPSMYAQALREAWKYGFKYAEGTNHDDYHSSKVKQELIEAMAEKALEGFSLGPTGTYPPDPS